MARYSRQGLSSLFLRILRFTHPADSWTPSSFKRVYRTTPRGRPEQRREPTAWDDRVTVGCMKLEVGSLNDVLLYTEVISYGGRTAPEITLENQPCPLRLAASMVAPRTISRGIMKTCLQGRHFPLFTRGVEADNKSLTNRPHSVYHQQMTLSSPTPPPLHGL